MTLDYLKAEAAKGQRSDFTRYLDLVPDVPAQPGDDIDQGMKDTRSARRR
jgi:hypothetical protein